MEEFEEQFAQLNNLVDDIEKYDILRCLTL